MTNLVTGTPLCSGITESFARIRRQDAARAKRYRERHPAAFVGVDGEGGNLPSGKHVYWNLRAGSDVLETGHPLATMDCLEFLSELPKGPIYVGYFFDYDSTMILRGISPQKIRRILDRESRMGKNGQAYPVNLGRYQVDYLPGKEFKVRKTGQKRWTVVNDVGSFFQCKFVEALELWQIGTEKERAQIAEGKDRRAHFAGLDDEIREYNALECRLLAELMERFREVCQQVGYVPKKWQGPGQLASAMLRAHGVPRKDYLLDHLPPALWQAANDAYYGGRFEVSAVGPVTGPVFQWDINSAYPWALTQLPCLIHGTWTQESDPDPDSLYLAYGSFTATEPAMWYGYQVRRKDGSIFCPQNGTGWYWSCEIQGAIHQTFSVERSWQYHRNCECEPFGWVPDVYAERRKLGKSARGLTLKLALNSLYGKMAQSVGLGPYANPVWASLITALTRAKLQDVIHDSPLCGVGLCGRDVVMLATDGVFTTVNRPDLDPNKALGGWDLTIYETGMFIIQPGLYFADEDVKPKTRGLPMRKVVEYRDEFVETWYDIHHGCNMDTGDLVENVVSVPVQSFIGLRLAGVRGFELAGSWDHKCELPGCLEDVNHVHKSISFDWANKRDPGRGFWDGDAWRPLPQASTRSVVSVPYKKEIGAWRDALRLDLADNPDFVPSL